MIQLDALSSKNLEWSFMYMKTIWAITLLPLFIFFNAGSEE